MISASCLPYRPISAFALAIALASTSAPAAFAQDGRGSVQDFQLPPSSTPTPTPQVQGPVDPDAPSTAPRVIPTARPTPRPTPRPTQTIVVPTPSPTPTPAPAQIDPRRRFTPATSSPDPDRQSTPLRDVPAAPLPTATDTPGQTLPLPGELPSQAPVFGEQPTTSAADETSSGGSQPWWIWLAGAFGLLLIGGLLWRLLAARRSATAPEIEPPIEQTQEPLARMPESEPIPESETPPAPIIPAAATVPIAPGEALSVAFEPLSMALSVMNATLSYRLSITPGPGVAPDAMAIGGDMVAAHASLPVQQQLADPAVMLPEKHVSVDLSNGDTTELNGTITLPISAIRPIRQGNAALFVPLVRLTFDNVGQAIDPMTFVLGEQSARQTGNLQPLRIDEGPRTVRQMIARRLG